MAGKSSRENPWKVVVINGKRKYMFAEPVLKDQSKVRAPRSNLTTSQRGRDAINCSSTTTCTTTTTSDVTDLSDLESRSVNLSHGPEGDDERLSHPDLASSSTSMEVSSEVAYAAELSRLDMVTVVTSSAFVFPDFNIESKQIKEMEFITVHRRVWHHLPTNRYDWLYSCSCCPRRSQLLSGLSKSLQEEPVDLNNSECIHIKAICHLLVEYDSHHGVSLEMQEYLTCRNDHTYEMHDTLIGVSIHEESSIGVLLKQRDGSIKCIICASIQCEHVMLVKRWPLDDSDIPELLVDFFEQDAFTGNSRNCLVSPVSVKKIPFNLPGCLRPPFLNGPETTLPKATDEDGKVLLALVPEIPSLNDDPCHLCGNRFREEDPREEGWLIKSVKLYGKRRIFDCLGNKCYFLHHCSVY